MHRVMQVDAGQDREDIRLQEGDQQFEAHQRHIERHRADGADHAERWNDATTAAWGLRVPAAIGDRLMLRAIRDSGGRALAVSEIDMARDMEVMREREGIDACEEGGAALAALRVMLASGATFAGPVVLFNTGSALKYGPRTS